MTDPLRTPEDYELFLYTLTERFQSVRRSTVTFARRGGSLARVAGELYFEQDIRLVVRERVQTREGANLVLDLFRRLLQFGAQRLLQRLEPPSLGLGIDVPERIRRDTLGRLLDKHARISRGRDTRYSLKAILYALVLVAPRRRVGKLLRSCTLETHSTFESDARGK